MSAGQGTAGTASLWAGWSCSLSWAGDFLGCDGAAALVGLLEPDPGVGQGAADVVLAGWLECQVLFSLLLLY